MPSRTICVYYMSFHVFIFPGIRSPFLFKKMEKRINMQWDYFNLHIYMQIVCVLISNHLRNSLSVSKCNVLLYSVLIM